MMLRLLIILGVALYSVMLIGGEDTGQTRAGLRDAPDTPAPPPETALAEAGKINGTAAADASVTLASLPAQPIRILPPPPRQEPVALAEPAVVPEADADAAAETPSNTTLAWVTVDRANVRQAPSRQASVSGRVERGEALLVLWTEPSGWVRVRVEGDGVDGFVHKSLLTETPPSQ